MLEVQHESHWSKIKVSAGLHSLPNALEENLFSSFPTAGSQQWQVESFSYCCLSRSSMIPSPFHH